MRKMYKKRGGVGKASRKERRKRQAEKAREIQLVLDPAEVLAMLQDSMTGFATEIGLKVARLLLADEVNQRCGSRYKRAPERTVTRYGHQRGVAVSREQVPSCQTLPAYVALAQCVGPHRSWKGT